MITNTKPQAINLGRVLDDESINSNVKRIDTLNPNYRYLFGKSSPIVTTYNIAERDLFPDANFCNSLIAADQHLRAQGLIPAWKRSDIVRLHRHQWMHRSWTEYAGAQR
jgi:hypothetical protein